MRPRRRDPREEKQLSYARDRRNGYGQNDKASRRAIPRNKRQVNQVNRHAVQQDLATATGPVDLDRAEGAEHRVRGRRPATWRKCPDLPLGEHVQRQAQRRASGDPGSTA